MTTAMGAATGFPARVLVSGQGIAAACCAHLLRRAGIAVRIEPTGRPRVPVILLSEPALALIREVFDRPDLLAGRPRTERRVVSWGRAAVALPHAAVVTSEDELLAALDAEPAPDFEGPPDFTVRAAASPAEAPQRRFGARKAVAAEVQVKRAQDLSACWAEAAADGWLFLAPNPLGSTWLLAVGAPPEQLLAQSRLIGPRVEPTGARSGAFDVCPRIAAAIAGEDWLACGTAAVAFDPICGDGVAQAVREAILASAVIAGLRDGGDPAALLGHYEAMLIAAMRRHLKLCADYYAAGGAGPWWAAEAAALAEGHHWCTGRLAAAPEPRFVLRGFALAPREAAA